MKSRFSEKIFGLFAKHVGSSISSNTQRNVTIGTTALGAIYGSGEGLNHYIKKRYEWEKTGQLLPEPSLAEIPKSAALYAVGGLVVAKVGLTFFSQKLAEAGKTKNALEVISKQNYFKP